MRVFSEPDGEGVRSVFERELRLAHERALERDLAEDVDAAVGDEVVHSGAALGSRRWRRVSHLADDPPRVELFRVEP